MAGALVVFAALVAYEKRKAVRDGSPLVELSLFRVKSFAAGIAVQTVFGVALGVFFLVWTLYMQTGLGWSPLRAGLTGVPFSIAVSTAAGLSVQQLVPRFGRRVLQAGALLMAVGVLLYIWESDRYGMAIASWQMALPLVVMGVGMGLIVAPLTDAVLSDVPREHAGSASGLINTVQQMGNALGLGLVSVVFFGEIGDRLTRAQVGPAFVNAFQHALGWVAGVMGVIFLLMFALPRRAVQHVEGARSWRPTKARTPSGPPVDPRASRRPRVLPSWSGDRRSSARLPRCAGGGHPVICVLNPVPRGREQSRAPLGTPEAADVMATREQASSPEAAAPQAAQSNWLPALSLLSLGEIAALDSTALEPSVEHLRLRVNRPLSTVAGSSGS